MPTTQKGFSGVMNLDDINDVIPQSHHKDAKNVVFRGNGVNQIVQNIYGNRKITTTLPAGTNSCIGTYYDQLNQRLFYFNYNSNNNHGIYIYNTVAKTIQRLFLSNTDSDTDILQFNIFKPITSINILYGDIYNSSLDTEGNILYWIDSLGRPSKLNIDRKLAAVYSVYQRSYLDVAKAPPAMPPKCTYENDTLVTNNNLKNSLFQFIYRFVYDDNERSVWSSGSVVPLPYNFNNVSVASDPTKNSRIATYLSTGDETIRKIELAVRRTSDGITSDYGLITSLNKSDTVLSVQNNTVYRYLFYNNSVPIPIDQAEAVLLYDYVPQSANTQELLNGTTLIYGGITEGYNQVDDASMSGDANISTTDFDNIPGLLMFAHQNGSTTYTNSNDIYIILTGAGTNNVSNVPATIDTANGAHFWIDIYIQNISTPVRISYNSSTTTISTILTGLAASAATHGATTTITGNVLKISTSLSVLHLQKSTAIQFSGYGPFTSSLDEGAISTLADAANYRYGLVYYDEKGRTNGVVTTDGLKVTTKNFDTIVGGVGKPRVTITIINNAPIWASYYHVVRTDNLTYNKNLFWVSKRAFANYSTDISTPYPIAYIGIDNMSYYNESIQSTSGYISYDYTAGDRIKFLKRCTPGGSSGVISPIYDCEIIGLEYNPTVNGYVAEGTYIKIKYPTLAINSNFQFLEPNQADNTSVHVEDFQHYEILIYNNKKTDNTNNVYYEVGEQCQIINPGTVNAWHTGNFQNQGCAPRQLVVKAETVQNIVDFSVLPTGTVSYSGTQSQILYTNDELGSPFLDSNLYVDKNGINVLAQLTNGTGTINYYISDTVEIYTKVFSAWASSGYYRLYVYDQTNGVMLYNSTVANPIPSSVTKQHDFTNTGFNPSINTPSYSQPAITNVYSGDLFLRWRNVPIGSKYIFSAGGYEQNASGADQFKTMEFKVTDSANSSQTISTYYYDIKSVTATTASLASGSYPQYTDNVYVFYNKTATTKMYLRVAGILPANTINSKVQYLSVYAKVLTTTSGYPSYNITNLLNRGALPTTNDKYEFKIDTVLYVPPGGKVYLITECQSATGNSIQIGTFQLTLDVIENTKIQIAESSISDVYVLDKNDDSRPVIFDENAKQAYYPTLVRYGLQRVIGSTINQTNRFYPANMDEYDRQKGEIQRLKVRGNQMRVFQNRGCGVASVLENMIFNADGGENLIQTNKIINQIHYYQGEYGLGGLKTSLASSANADYFVDPIRGYQVRLSQDGITPISEIYKAQYYITNLSTKYVKPVNGTLGGYAKVLGIYDFYEEEYVSVFQAYSGQANTTLGFSEAKNCYSSFYDYAPEWITSAESSVITFKAGELYLHDNTASYNTFYGTSYPSSITLVYNPNPTIKKDFNAITQDAPSAWTSSGTSDISTSLGQISNLVTSDYEINEGFYHAAFLRDGNSIGGVIEGDYLKGSWLQSKLSNSSTNFVYLSGVYVNFTVSQRNG